MTISRLSLRLLPTLPLVGLLVTGCRHARQVAYAPPPPAYDTTRHSTHGSPDVAAEADGTFDNTHVRPVFTETGLATWYGPHYNRKPGADGTTYDQNQMTAAHRTLPLGSTVRVTNVATGQQVLVRITDRGPFSPGRVLDLSLSAAKAVGVYRTGVAEVKLEAFPHASADPAGRWCVQTGAFHSEEDALDLKAALLSRYRGAKVAEFHSVTGYWVRIDPADHARSQAVAMLDWIGKPDPQSLPYLVRID